MKSYSFSKSTKKINTRNTAKKPQANLQKVTPMAKDDSSTKKGNKNPFQISKELIQNKMEEIETKLQEKPKPAHVLAKLEMKRKQEMFSKKYPKYQKMIDANFDMCKSLRGFRNSQPSKYDFFQVTRLKLLENEKAKE